MSERRSDAAVIAMYECGWFSRGPAFWHWIETPEATPYVEAFALRQQPLAKGEPLDLLGDDDDSDLLDPAHLALLAREIKARFGNEG